MRKQLSSFLSTFSLILLGLFLLFLPFAVLNLTTDYYSLPKQFALSAVVLIAFLFYGIKSLTEKTVKFRKTPFDFPVLIFAFVVFLSSVLAVNKAESLVAFVSLLFSVSLFYLLTNFAKTRKAVFILLAAFFEGAIILSALYILSFFKAYILPFSITHSQVFTPLGTLLDQLIYVSAALGFGVYFFNQWRTMKLTKSQKREPKFLLTLGVAALETAVLITGLGLTVYALFKLQNPLILPLSAGFQIGFAAISQDISRTIPSFLLGSGFGTFATDFSRFKLAALNNDPTLWSLTFFKSSSFILELLATTGVLGILSFFFLSYKTLKQKPLFPPLLIIFLLSLILPFSTTSIILLFAVLGLYAALQGLSDKNYYDVELGLVTLKSGIVTVAANEKKEVRHGLSGVLTLFVFLLIVLITAVSGFFLTRYALANITFQKSLTSGSNGTQVYQLQSQAIEMVPYSDAYQRVFSQTNLSLANSLSQSTPKGASPSAQTQQTIYTLIQQSINSGRTATTLSPLSPINWQNLSGIYRSLIGFGKNADQFAIQASQQAIQVDPNNPQEYINLGGLYYQLKDFTNAEQQFRVAINLKPDFANAHYNLAHALLEKGDAQGALRELEQVKQLVKNDPTNLKKIQSEIDLINSGLNASKTAAGAPKTELPPQNPPVAIPAPSTPLPTPTPTGTPTPTTAPLQ